MDQYAVMQSLPPSSPPQNPGYEHQKHQQKAPARPGKRRGRKPGIHSSAIQRNAANARERSRMRVLSAAFAKLKSVLPWVPRDTKLSKLDTLKLASGYIALLKRTLDEPEAQDTSAPISSPPISRDQILGTLMKGSTSRLKIKHEEQSTLQTSESKKPQEEYAQVDGQAVQANLQQPLWWTWCDGTMGCLNDPSYAAFFPHSTSETAATTTNDLVISTAPLSPSSSITTSSQRIDDNLPTVVFQRQFF
ncbi:Transcription factor 21 [Taenia solium]|eukprot:TsM_000945000 transcript=TsM_000945000 gene=TsM_000945000